MFSRHLRFSEPFNIYEQMEAALFTSQIQHQYNVSTVSTIMSVSASALLKTNCITSFFTKRAQQFCTCRLTFPPWHLHKKYKGSKQGSSTV
jgi:hypothetical protein